MEKLHKECGEEWKECVMKMNKERIVDLFSDVCKERTKLRNVYNKANYLIAELGAEGQIDTRNDRYYDLIEAFTIYDNGKFIEK